MSIMERPVVTTLDNGSKYWEHTYEKFHLKNYIPATDIDGQVNNYTFEAPLLLIFEEKKQTIDEAIRFAEESGLAGIASAYDGSVLFVYPTCEGGWKNADEDLYVSLIAEVSMATEYDEGIVSVNDFFTRTFKGYFIRGAKFRADIYSFGESADYVATHLLKTIKGEFLWGPGEICPACCSMERLSVNPVIERTDIPVLSVGNSDEINSAFTANTYFLAKQNADYTADFKSFVHKFKMWCNAIQLEPDFAEMNMTEEAGMTVVKTDPKNMMFKDTAEHKVGYFAYYNNGILDKGPVPMVVGFHGGGDTSMYLTYVAGWYEICHKYGFLFVSIENHQGVPASEAAQVVEHLKKKYNVDPHRVYATGFSMGSGKTWDMFMEYPEMFAAVAPHCALFPMKNNVFGKSIDEGINMDIPVPMFYSGGEMSHLPELPFQAEQCLERIQYAAKVNRCKHSFNYDFADKENWPNPIYAEVPDRVEKIPDESRGSVLTINYYDSEDGVCRMALASVSGQVHECRHHTCENAWKFISQFSR